jgi:hypothetical protein
MGTQTSMLASRTMGQMKSELTRDDDGYAESIRSHENPTGIPPGITPRYTSHHVCEEDDKTDEERVGLRR